MNTTPNNEVHPDFKSFQVLDVCRADIMDGCEAEITREAAASIDDIDMEGIARELQESLMNDYWCSLQAIVATYAADLDRIHQKS